jgi:hypothetical protein
MIIRSVGYDPAVLVAIVESGVWQASLFFVILALF